MKAFRYTVSHAMQADRVDRFTASVSFGLLSGANFCAPHPVESRIRLARRRVLEPPRIELRHDDRISAAEAGSNADEMLRYYRDLISIATENGVPSACLVDRMTIGIYIDHLDRNQTLERIADRSIDKTAQFVKWVSAGASGDAYHDREQSWALSCLHVRDRPCLITYEPDHHAVFSHLSFDTALLASALARSQAQAVEPVTTWRTVLGTDAWSESPSFATRPVRQ